jgi:hypothetical protein
MKFPKLILLALICQVFTMQVFAQQNKLSSVKIYVSPASDERLRLIELLQLDHFQEENGAIFAEINSPEMEALRISGFRYEAIIDDVAANLQVINRSYFEGRANGTINMDGSLRAGYEGRVAFEQPGGLLNDLIVTPSAFVVQTGSPNLGGYYTYAQMVTAITNLFNTYSPSGLVDTFHIGTSIEGRIIYAVKISDNAAIDEPNEPEVFFQGVQHAREAIGGSSMIFLMQYLCERYTAADSRIVNLVNNREIYIVVCMNPDGWEYNRSTNPNGGGGWRKNRRNHGGGVFGVDLNRNWSTDWANCTGAVGAASCGSNNQSSDTYWGTGSFSEPETNAVRNFIRSKHIVAANDQHSVGPYYSLPFGRPGLHTGADTLTMAQQQWYTYITALMGKYNGMRAGNSVQALGYEVAGGVKDWFLKGEIGSGINGGQKYNILGMTGEGGYGTGASTFWPAASSIITLCKGMTYQNLQMIYAAGSYVELQDMSDIALTSLTGNLSFRIKRIGLDNQPVTVTAIPTINISSIGAPVTVASLPNYYDTYTGNISYTLPASITTGQRVMFVWKVETLGVTYYDTITKFYNPTVLFTDDMETGSVGTKWTITGGWNYVADSGYVASRALTESPGTSYTASSTRTATCNTTLDLTGATAAFLTFRTRHKAENFRDKLQVQVSPTGGNPWTALKGRTTVQEPTTNEGSTINGIPSLTGIKPDWVNEVFDLSGFLGQSALRFRFEFTSNASATFFASQDEGFYLDDIKVIRSTTNFITLGVDFISFNGKMLPSNEVSLTWQANTDNGHSHFEVEKSTDSRNFQTIGRVETNQPFQFLDRFPSIGNNYYRIKGIAVNGEAKYSKVINIVYNPSQFVINLFPNPVHENLTVKYKGNMTENISIHVSDLSGRVIISQQSIVSNSEQTININTQNLASQVYILKIVNSKNEILAIQKFVKQ